MAHPTGAQLVALTEQYEQLQLEFTAENEGGPAWRTVRTCLAEWRSLLGQQQELVFLGATDVDALGRLAMALEAALTALEAALEAARASALRLRGNTTTFMVQAIEVFHAQRPPGHTLLPPGAPIPVDIRNPALGHAASYAVDDAPYGEHMQISLL
jgi:hypothetical protein